MRAGFRAQGVRAWVCGVVDRAGLCPRAPRHHHHSQKHHHQHSRVTSHHPLRPQAAAWVAGRPPCHSTCWPRTHFLELLCCLCVRVVALLVVRCALLGAVEEDAGPLLALDVILRVCCVCFGEGARGEKATGRQMWQTAVAGRT